MKSSKIAIVLSVVLLFNICFTSCAPTDNSVSSSSDSSVSNESSTLNEVSDVHDTTSSQSDKTTSETLVSTTSKPTDSTAKLSQYTIVYDRRLDYFVKENVFRFEQLANKHGGIAGVTDDQAPVTKYEILIGDTNRPESIAAEKYVSSRVKEDESWYYIDFSNNKIVLIGKDEEGISAAIKHYMNNCFHQTQTGEIKTVKKQLHTYKKNTPTLTTTNMGDSGKKSVFVSTINLENAPYLLDKTGTFDETESIQRALDYVEFLGGGVIYLPSGTYRISNTLKIPSNVTLRGDYVDPDKDHFSKGTVLLIDSKNFSTEQNAILLQRTSMALGLTIFYEGQNINSPIEYAATFLCAPDSACWEIRDCTLVNSYIGISNNTSPNGMITIHNVKGTALYNGYRVEQRSDVSAHTNITFSPKYWASAGKKWNAPTEAAIRSYMKKKNSVGIFLGDCDRDTYENIYLDGFYTGIYNREMTRVGLSGSYYNIQILDATIGIEGHGIDTRYGLLVSNSKIQATKTAVINTTETDSTFCNINLMNCDISGALLGKVKTLKSQNGASDSQYTPFNLSPPLPAEKLFNLAEYGVDSTGKKDISSALQAALNDAEKAGGGIVYLPAGLYLLEKPVSINGNNIQFAGCNLGAHTQKRDLQSSSILLITHGRDGNEDSTATITINGNNSGVTGLSVIYPKNGVNSGDEINQPKKYSYCIRAKGKQNYVTFIAMIAVSRAVHFDKAEDFICDRLFMTVWDSGVRANGCKGVISRIHTNGHYHTMGNECVAVLGENWCHQHGSVLQILDLVVCKRLTLITLENCPSIQIRHVFQYGSEQYLKASKSNIFILNSESARLTGFSFDLYGNNKVTVVNFMRPNPLEYLKQSGNSSVAIYNWGAAHYSGDRIVMINH